MKKECACQDQEEEGGMDGSVFLSCSGCVTKIMKKECACQDQEEEEGGMEEDEEAEQDEMLFE